MKLTIINSSVREGRIGPAISSWASTPLEAADDIELTNLDLADYELPRNLGRNEDVEVVAKILDASDAFIVITPEYNHGYPSELKLLLDSFTGPWATKPFGFIGYGGQAGGIRAVEQLKPVVAELHGVPVRDGVHLTSPWDSLDGSTYVPDERETRALATMTVAVRWWSDALAVARAVEPYPVGH